MLAHAERPESLASPNSCGLVLARSTAHPVELEGVSHHSPHRGDLSMLPFHSEVILDPAQGWLLLAIAVAPDSSS